MKSKLTETEEFEHVFLLNMQIILESLCEHFEPFDVHIRKDPQVLTGFRIYSKGATILPNILYIAYADQFDDTFVFPEKSHFLILGPVSLPYLPATCSVIQLSRKIEPAFLINICQNTFETFSQWDMKLHQALGSDNPIDDMLEASIPIFDNPIFAHDTQFYIISSPIYVPGMTKWIRDPRTGRDMIPLSLINELKADLEYLQTLGTHGPSLFSKELRGYRILYINLWFDHRYLGRICVNELRSSFTTTHYLALQHLAYFVQYRMKQHIFFTSTMGKNVDEFFGEYLDGSITDENEIMTGMEQLGWEQNDSYLSIRLENEHIHHEISTSAATLASIETQIEDGSAFIYKNGIAVIINLSKNRKNAANVISSLAIIMREGLFKMGVSIEFDDFLSIPVAYQQAVIALKLGKKSGSMIWCYRFEDFLLEYMIDRSTSRIPSDMLYSRKLLILKRYDEENNTEMLHTLHVFLNLERNVLQTAKTLFIHRSTLFYRLERIQKLAKVNLDNPKERLCLLLSFEIMKDDDQVDKR